MPEPLASLRDTTGVRATTRIPVRFSGDGAGMGPLSWGQRQIWLTMLRQRSWLPIGGWTRLATGTTLDDVVEELVWVMRRYPTYRTRLRFQPDGQPLQMVAAWGTIGLDVFDVPDGADPDVYTAAVDARYRALDYDFVADWPVRMGVIRTAGVPTHLSTVTCHLVTDGLGGQLMLREVADRHQAPPQAPPTGMQPLEQARWQASPAGQRQNATALRHWARTLRKLPPPRALDTGRPGPRWHRGEFRSPALYTGTHTVSNILDVDSSQILMTLLALAVTDLAGDGRPAVIRPMVSNRFRRGLADVVAMVAQRGICAADVVGVPFDEAVRRTGLAAMLAYKYAYYDQSAVDELTAALGADGDAGLWFNDRRIVSRQGFAGDTPTAEQVRNAPPGDFRWTVTQDDPYDPLSVDVDDAPGGLLLTWFTDTHRLAPARVEALARAVEALAVHHALLALETRDS